MLKVGLCGFTMSMEDYAIHFPVVEVQQTFYQPPRDETLARWLAATPQGLEFTLKVWQLVTHPSTSPTYRRTRRLLTEAERRECGAFRESAIVEEGYRRSLECARVLGSTAMLFQSPSSFDPTAENVARFRAFFARRESESSPRPRFLWEPRGAKWVAARDQARALCDELALVHVVDPFVTPPASRRGPVYWRLHGLHGARSSYSDAELARLRDMVDAARPLSDETAYILFNNLPRVGDARRFAALCASGR